MRLGKSSGVIGINLGKNKISDSPIEDYVKGIQVLGKYADYIVINVSSPNTPGLRALQRKDELQALIARVISSKFKCNIITIAIVLSIVYIR